MPRRKESTELHKLRQFAARVRCLKTITESDARAKVYESRDALVYKLGYNDAILRMREIFEEVGFSA